MTSVKDWAAPNPITENRSGLIGKGVDRYEGPLKVTGAAAYAYEVEPPSPPAYGYLVTATVAKGTVVSIDTAAAEAARHDGADTLLVDVAGPVRFVVQDDDLAALAEGYRLADLGGRLAWTKVVPQD